MLRSIAWFGLIAGVILMAWHALGRPLALPPEPPGFSGRLTCISYAPFHGDEAPFAADFALPDGRIAEDLRLLSAITPCVRTYSARGPQGRITPLAAAAGLKILQGIWIGRDRAENRREIEAALEIAHRYPGTVEALIVGNETLLRGELAQADIKAYLEEVGKRSSLPVTYADVWEFWLKATDLARAVDFVTIHILPYWEDKPVSEQDAIAHIREVHERVAAAFPGKDILIGEIGWPSRGRMREGALPSPVNQARFISGIVQLALEKGWKMNVVEAFDQRWKRLMEGTVGGYWGLYDGVAAPKFRFGEAVSNHPDWLLKASLGCGVALLVFLSFWAGARGTSDQDKSIPLAAAIALGAGLLFGLAALNLPLEGETADDRLRATLMLVLASAAPLAASFALAKGRPLPGFASALYPSRWHKLGAVEVVLSALLVATVVAAILVALGLVFDPRYKDFPFALLTGPVVAFFVLGLANGNEAASPGTAETVAAALLSASALFIVANEGLANWQALILAGLLLTLALGCLRAEAAPS